MTRVTSPLVSTRSRPSLMNLKKQGEYLRVCVCEGGGGGGGEEEREGSVGMRWERALSRQL